LLIFIKADVLEHVIPVTLIVPAVAVDDKLVIVFENTEIDVAALEADPIVIPVTLPPELVILLIVLLERVDTPFQYVKFIQLIELEVPDQLVRVFPVIVLVEPVPPSVLLNPVMVVVPVTVIFEKLLLV